MTANKIITKAVSLLGYTDDEGNITSPKIQTIALTALNTVYSDLYYLSNEEGFKEIGSASEEVQLPERIVNNVMVYGVASFIAQGIGDANAQQFFTLVYNSRRKSATAQTTITDTLPTIDGE